MIIICKRLVNKHRMLKFKGRKLIVNLCEIADAIVNESNSLKDIEEMLFDVTYSGIKLIDLVAIEDISGILKNPLIDIVVSNLYVGTFELDSFLEKSISYNIVSKNLLEHEDDGAQIQKRPISLFHTENQHDKGRARNQKCMKRLYKNMCVRRNEVFCRNRNTTKIIGHMFKFEVWTKSAETRHLIETVVILAIGILLIYFASDFLDQVKTASEINTDIQNDPDNEDSHYERLDAASDNFLRDTLILLYINISTNGYLVKNIMEIMYSNLRGIKIPHLSLEIITNTI